MVMAEAKVVYGKIKQAFEPNNYNDIYRLALVCFPPLGVSKTMVPEGSEREKPSRFRRDEQVTYIDEQCPVVS
jgi:hypothetical protein